MMHHIARVFGRSIHNFKFVFQHRSGEAGFWPNSRKSHPPLRRRPEDIQALLDVYAMGMLFSDAAKARLAAATAAVAAAKDEVNHNEVAIKNLEIQIQTRRDTIVKLKTQQFETRKNEEFTALAHEATRYEGDVAKLEDEEMVLMEKGEALKAA